MVSSKKENGERKKERKGVFKKKKKKKIIWVGIQHVRDYRAQGETAGASALARVYSQLFYDSGHDWLFGIKKGEKEMSPLCNGYMEIHVVGYMKQYV